VPPVICVIVPVKSAAGEDSNLPVVELKTSVKPFSGLLITTSLISLKLTFGFGVKLCAAIAVLVGDLTVARPIADVVLILAVIAISYP